MHKKFMTPLAAGVRALSPASRPIQPASDPDPNSVSGKIQAQYVRCGKASCHCASGELHGPYYYRIWRDGMRTRKVYVKPDEVDAVRAVCEENSTRMGHLRQFRKERRLASEQLRAVWRATQVLLRSAGLN